MVKATVDDHFKQNKVKIFFVWFLYRVRVIVCTVKKLSAQMADRLNFKRRSLLLPWACIPHHFPELDV